MFAINNGFMMPPTVYHRGYRKPTSSEVTDDQIRAAIPLGTTKGAAKVKLSVSSFIRRRRLIEEAESLG